VRVWIELDCATPGYPRLRMPGLRPLSGDRVPREHGMGGLPGL
jgi:hypothetical protein